MAVGLLIITHNLIGEDLLSTARSMLGRLPLETAWLAVSQSGDPDDLLTQALVQYRRSTRATGCWC
jgi:mannose PTS system EIIA component